MDLEATVASNSQVRIQVSFLNQMDEGRQRFFKELLVEEYSGIKPSLLPIRSVSEEAEAIFLHFATDHRQHPLWKAQRSKQILGHVLICDEST